MIVNARYGQVLNDAALSVGVGCLVLHLFVVDIGCVWHPVTKLNAKAAS